LVENAWLNLIPGIRGGLTEVYCHPAARISSLLHELTPSYRHLDEYKALLSPRVKERLEGHDISLTSFSDAVRNQISELADQ
jgi:hypothetical protein